jgi:putative membrane-bound dehydrogenase-like protein
LTGFRPIEIAMKIFTGKITALFLFLCLTQLSFAQTKAISPTDKNGRALNLDFEDGTLRDWKTTGNAFAKQPVEGDVIVKRRGDMRSQHQGNFWIGTYENGGDDLTGTLTSVPFKVTQPYCAFLVAGGSKAGTRVELYDVGIKKPFFQISGEDSENLRPIVVELKGHVGREMYIRVVDSETGGWGHINFDDFKFYEEPPTLPNAIDLNNRSGVPAADEILYAGLSPEDAAAKMTLPPGFKATLFAGEPDVKQPIAFAIDDRGRLWVAEAYTYPNRIGTAPAGNSSEPNAAQLKDIFGGKDRVICFEDSDGDGKFDKRTVVVEHLNLVSGIEVGFGGIYVGAAPYLMYFKIKDGDEPKAVGNPQILLDGWAYQDTHETLNTFTWGPDGWLYGCQGVFTHSVVGKPGASKSERTPVNAGVWRYHPTKHIFELFSEGTSNPWGIDFDAHGQCWIEACVIPHLFHMIQGARYERQAGQHFNPNIYEDIKTVADHVHYAGNKGPHAANGRSDAAGGGHAHAGMMVYLGGSFPEKYNGALIMNNIHGQRLNMDVPERKGSGFVGHHAPDFVNFNDSWSQVLNMLYDQDGSVYMIDWYDKNQCHHNNEAGHDRSNGRIFKLVYNDQKVTPIDLKKKSSAELVQLISEKNEFYARHARRILAERGPNAEVHTALKQMLKNSVDDVHQLRALWTLHVTGGLDESFALSLLKNPHEYVRAWAIQLMCEDAAPGEGALKEFARLAASDPSPVVRLYLASAMQRTPPAQRWDVVTNLFKHGEDANDHNLPVVYWCAAEASVAADPERAVRLLTETKIPKLRQFIAHRVTVSSKMVAAK